MNKWQNVFSSFTIKTIDEYSWAISSMNLFPQWATKYWCNWIWEHGSEFTPVELLQKSLFSSFFFRPCSLPPMITLLYMQIWSGIHMAYYLFHQDVKSAYSFMSEMSLEFAETLNTIPVCDAGQGDWKCHHCLGRTVRGTIHVCTLCSNPVSYWAKYV